MPETRLNVQAHCATAHLTVMGLAGLTGLSLDLASPDGKWKLQLPREAFRGLRDKPGDTLVLTIGVVRIGVEEAEPANGGLLLPGRAN